MNLLLLLFATLLIGLAGFLITPPIVYYSRRFVHDFEARIAAIFSEMFIQNVSPRMVTLGVAIGIAFVIMIFVTFLGMFWGLLLGIIIGLLLPLALLRSRIRQRRARLETQLLDGLITLGNGMRAGLNLPQAMGLIEQHGEAPLSQEFGLVLREIEHGAGVDVALDRAGTRIRSHNFRLLFAALKTTRQRGGNLPDTLDRLGNSLREITRLEEKVKSQTAQHRTTAIIMGLMPSVFLLIYYLIDSETVKIMFTEPVGQVVLAFVVLLNLVGFLWIRSIVNFEI